MNKKQAQEQDIRIHLRLSGMYKLIQILDYLYDMNIDLNENSIYDDYMLAVSIKNNSEILGNCYIDNLIESEELKLILKRYKDGK